MVQVNADYLKLKAGYLFPEISRRIKDFNSKNPNVDLIRLGIGDVTEPLPLACREAMKAAIEEMGTGEGFEGYGLSKAINGSAKVSLKMIIYLVDVIFRQKKSLFQMAPNAIAVIS